MIPHVGPNIYEDTAILEIFSNNLELFCLVKFAVEVVGLNQIVPVPHKKSKIFSKFIYGHKNPLNSYDISDSFCYREASGSA